MPKPILVGYGPSSPDHAPVEFGTAAARFTGAPLIVASVHSSSTALGPTGGERSWRSNSRTTPPSRSTISDAVSAPTASGPNAAPYPARAPTRAPPCRGGVRRRPARRRIDRPWPRRPRAARLDRAAPGARCAVPDRVVPHGLGGGRRHQHDRRCLRRHTGRSRRAQRRCGPRTACRRVLRVLQRGQGEGLRQHVRRPRRDDTRRRPTRMSPARTGRGRAQRGGGQWRARATSRIDYDVSIGDAATSCVAASERLDLLIYGSRGYGPARSVMLGRVSHRVTAEPHCPVIVLARGTEAGLEALIEGRAGTVWLNAPSTWPTRSDRCCRWRRGRDQPGADHRRRADAGHAARAGQRARVRARLVRRPRGGRAIVLASSAAPTRATTASRRPGSAGSSSCSACCCCSSRSGSGAAAARGRRAPLPKWMQAIDTFTPAGAAALGAALSASTRRTCCSRSAPRRRSPRPGSRRPSRRSRSPSSSSSARSGAAPPVAITSRSGERSGASSTGSRRGWAHNNAAIMAVLCLVIGAKLIGDAISGLA